MITPTMGWHVTAARSSRRFARLAFLLIAGAGLAAACGTPSSPSNQNTNDGVKAVTLQVTDDPAFKERAVLAELSTQNKLLTGKSSIVGVPSYFATDVAPSGNRLYITSGSGSPNSGGLTILDAGTLAQVSGGEAFLEARDVSASGQTYIAANSSSIFAANGTGGLQNVQIVLK